MTLETKKDRNAETPDVWETLLTRRLSDDLDAFLEESADETFLFDDEGNAPSRTKRIGKSLRFKALATIAASAFLVVGVATTRLYVESPKPEEVAKSCQVGDEPSLLAWSVENLSETPWARQIETKLATANVFGLYAAPSEEPESERLAGIETNTSVEESETAESEANAWFSAETLSDVAAARPLKYEPFLQAVVATLQ